MKTGQTVLLKFWKATQSITSTPEIIYIQGTVIDTFQSGNTVLFVDPMTGEFKRHLLEDEDLIVL